MSGARRLPRNQQPTKSARIFEGRHGLDGVLRSSGKNDLAVALLQLADGDGDVMLADAEESAGADDGVGDRFVRGNDDVVGLADRLALVVVDRLSPDLTPGTPSHGDVPQFGHRHAQLRGADNLLTLRCAGCTQQHRTYHRPYHDASLHVFTPCCWLAIPELTGIVGRRPTQALLLAAGALMPSASMRATTASTAALSASSTAAAAISIAVTA